MIDWIYSVINTKHEVSGYVPETWGLDVGPIFTAKLPSNSRFPSRFSENISNGQNREKCGKVFNGQESGVFSSPEYPRHYPSDTHCEWKIEPSFGMNYIRLNVTDMKFDARSSGCFINDHIRVYDGSNKQGRVAPSGQ